MTASTGRIRIMDNESGERLKPKGKSFAWYFSNKSSFFRAFQTIGQKITNSLNH